MAWLAGVPSQNNHPNLYMLQIIFMLLEVEILQCNFSRGGDLSRDRC
jgi:hypothetical protein